MSVRIHVDCAAMATTLTFTGSVRIDDFADAREVTALELSSEDIRKLAAAVHVVDSMEQAQELLGRDR